MILYLDCEFNGFGGELLSVALVPEIGDSFYRIISDTKEPPTEWVAEHVLPLLSAFPGASERGTRGEIRSSLQAYLRRFTRIHIVADWPEDIAHFCRLLLTDVPGERISTPPLTLEIIRVDCPSAMPHNALADATGIRNECLRKNLVS